jgi:hypothetical protein
MRGATRRATTTRKRMMVTATMAASPRGGLLQAVVKAKFAAEVEGVKARAACQAVAADDR